MGSLSEVKRRETIPSSPDPVVIELQRLENNLREKERELKSAHCEIKALKVTEILKDKTFVELGNELKKLESKIRNADKHLEDKNLELKKVTSEKKEALAKQFAAEGTLRRVHADKKDEESVPVEAIIAPYESEIRKFKNEITSLQDDNRALERLIKSKDVALVEAERMFHSSQERASTVENLQNKNLELKRQIEICLEENRLLEKANKQKVVEVGKLSQTIRELEESILAGGAAANVVRDYQRQIFDINEEKKTLERELARVKVSANRRAIAVANEWKDEGEKAIPAKQWMEERKFLQGEIQRLRDKLALAEKTVKAETQLRDKFKFRLKTLEEGLKGTSNLSIKETKRSDQGNGFIPCNGTPAKRSSSQPRSSIAGFRTSILLQPNPASSVKKTACTNNITTKSIAGENLVRRNLWAPRSKFFDDNAKENTGAKLNFNGQLDITISPEKSDVSHVVSQANGHLEDESEDSVSGFLYDRLQKEIINMRKSLDQKDEVLSEKDDELKLLQRKTDALSKALEVEAKKTKREAAIREKEISLKLDDNIQKSKVININKRSVMSPKGRT